MDKDNNIIYSNNIYFFKKLNIYKTKANYANHYYILFK